MDNLTHTLAGLAISRLGFDRRVNGATLTLALASNLPDLDIVSGFWGRASYLEHHRAISHAFPASPFLAAALAALLVRWSGSQKRFVPTFLLAWLGVVLHIVADLWTSYGTRVFLPFDATWYSLDWIFIVDPLLMVLLFVGSFGAWSNRRPRLDRWAMAAVVLYIGVRAGAHGMAQGQAQSLAGPEFTLVRAMPDPLNLNRWRFIASSDATFETGYVPAYGTSRSKVTFPRLPPNDLARRVAKESHDARVFLDFSAFPRFESRKEEDLTVLIWRDLRFADRRADGFLCEVKVDREGRIVSERVVF